MDCIESNGDFNKIKKKSLLDSFEKNDKKGNFLDYFLNKQPKKTSQNFHINVDAKTLPKKNSFIYKSHNNLRELIGQNEEKKDEIQSPYQNFFKSKGNPNTTATPLRNRKSILKEEEILMSKKPSKDKKLLH